MNRLTDKAVDALRPKAQRYETWEGNGFGVRVTPRGIKSFVWVYRFGGRTRRMTLGTYPSIALTDARIKLANAQKLLKLGKDPGAAIVEQRRTERQADTVAELVNEYLEKWARPRKRSAAEDERILLKDVVPAWGRRKAKDITRRDAIALLDFIVERGAPIQANRTLAVVRKMFNWAIGRDITESNPCHMVPAPAKENRRDRVLTADEIRTFWTGLEDARMSDTAKLALRFQLVTAQRKGEVIGAEFDDVECDVWTIPAEKAKNGMAHRVPLSPLALDILQEIKENAGESGWLVPSPRGDMPITGPSLDHAVRNNQDHFSVEKFTPHDLRRTAASHMTSMGITRLVVAKILNHAEPGVTATYDRHGYDAEKRHALDAWGARLQEFIAGDRTDNVVRLSSPTRA